MTTRTGNIILCSGDNTTFDIKRGSFTKTFPNHNSRDDRIGLLNASIYYSWNNVTSQFNNSTGLSYVWTDGVSYPVDYVPGFYSISDLNDYLTFKMRANGHFLRDAGDAEIFYLQWEINPVYYAVTLTSTPIPTVLPAGMTNPNGVVLNGKAPQLVLSAQSKFHKLIGFLPGSYPPTQGSYRFQTNGTLIPQISPVSTVLILCDWVNDGRFSSMPSVIGSFAPNVDFGRLIDHTPVTITTYQVTPRSYDRIVIRFVSQDFVPLEILDGQQTIITLVLESQD